MNVLLFGATGMVGQGVLLECLRDPGVERVLIIGRSKSGVTNGKIREIIHANFLDFSALEPQISGFDACFFCLGVSSVGMRPADYERITYGITLAAAEALARLNPQMTFIYVSGAGTDSSEQGRVRWARVKGKTENALLRLPFKSAFMFRPGIIQPLDGIKSKTRGARIMYQVAWPILPALHRWFPSQILDTREIGRAMIIAAHRGAPKPVLETRDIRALISAH